MSKSPESHVYVAYAAEAKYPFDHEAFVFEDEGECDAHIQKQNEYTLLSRRGYGLVKCQLPLIRIGGEQP